MSEDKSSSRARKIMGVGLLCFLVLGFLIMLLCDFRAKYASQSILVRERDLEQAWLAKALDAIAVWRNEITEQARFVSTSEMFRLFISDVNDMGEEDRRLLGQPDTLHSPREPLRNMAEQLSYLQDLLNDLTKRRAWNEARILRDDASQLIGPEYAQPLAGIQLEIARQALAGGKPVFGPLRMREGLLVMDMAEPMFEVLGSGDPRVIGVLMLTLPMERPLAGFLSGQADHREGLESRIAEQTPAGVMLARMESGEVMLDGIAQMPPLNLPFGKREALDRSMEVYSLGARPTGMNWRYVLETPAALVDELIRSQKIQIYGLGLLASLGMALLGAFIWARVTSRQHMRRVRELTELNRRINQQKIMLESINSSMSAGLLLVDDHDNVLVANRNFLRITGRPDGTVPPHAPLSEVAPPDWLVPMQSQMRRVLHDGKASDSEIEISRDGEKSIFRVHYYPYVECAGTRDERVAGCVAIVQDITRYRMQALEKARKHAEKLERQDKMIRALGHAVESIDENLVGQSDRMQALAAELSRAMGLGPEETETLAMAARLSQLGRIFVPRELLNKRKLSPEELAEVKKAPEYAYQTLKGMFDLPVAETVAEMFGKLDENGRIRGTDKVMSRCGRALGAISALVAMTSPRAYRDDPEGGTKGMSLEKALETLAADGAFCPMAVGALQSMEREALRSILSGKSGNAGQEAGHGSAHAAENL